jgi:hypothetical protein
MIENSNYKLKILSLGAGVQSSTLLLMACKGIIEKPNLAIFADTGWESIATYMHLEFLKAEGRKHGIEVMTVNNGDVREIISDPLWKCDKLFLPVFLSKDSMSINGMFRRKCTGEKKITPIRNAIRKLLGLVPRQRAPKDCVEQWIGISIDEAHRTFSRQKDRITFLRYPLIEMNMTRTDCEKWLSVNYQITVPKSSCVGCPFHNTKEWMALSDEEFKSACDFDNSIRNIKGIIGTAYLHRSCKPLEEVDFRSTQEIMEQDHGQQNWIKDEKLNLFVNNISIADVNA